jgi:RES domain-containing protein
MDSLANAVAGQEPVHVIGTWHRHLPARYVDSAMEGRLGMSRWGRRSGFPLLYLGKPTDSVVVEAYRHLVDPVVDDTSGIKDAIAPRALVTADVSVTEILDLRTSRARMELGLSLEQMQSGTQDRDAYGACQEVASAAHQQGFHGLIAPAATKLGETLVLFTQILPESEIPTVTDTTLWTHLPDDPRTAPSLRIVRDEEA